VIRKSQPISGRYTSGTRKEAAGGRKEAAGSRKLPSGGRKGVT